jgi:hypothetical protein
MLEPGGQRVELVRVTTDAWGREVLEGISWDLLPIAVAIGAFVIVAHAIWRYTRKGRKS